MKPTMVFIVAALLLYLIFSGKAERLWFAVTS
jgi:hypothetical protein